jgi:hypothetical protein
VPQKVMQGGARFLQPVGEEEMDKYTATQRAWPADFWSVRDEPSLLPRSECKAALWLTRGEALILVLLLSFGLWAAIWGAVALLGAGGRW